MNSVDNEIVAVHEKLKEYISSLGYTQQQLADLLGVSQAAVGALLNGKPFGKGTAKRWGELLGIQPSWLLTGDGDMLKSGGVAIEGNNNTAVNGDKNKVNIGSIDVDKLLHEMAEQRKMYAAQMDRLLTMLEKK